MWAQLKSPYGRRGAAVHMAGSCICLLLTPLQPRATLALMRTKHAPLPPQMHQAAVHSTGQQHTCGATLHQWGGCYQEVLCVWTNLAAAVTATSPVIGALFTRKAWEVALHMP